MGKNSPSTPPAPDYAGAATATATGNLEAARAAASANRVNQVTPYGNLNYSQDGRKFDQAGYDNAMASYNTANNAYNASPAQSAPSNIFGGGTPGTPDGEGGMTGGGGVGGNTNTANRGFAPTAPDRNSFYSGSQDGGWTATQSLAPAQQAILDQNNQLNTGLLKTANRGLGFANDVLSRPGISGYDVQKPGDFSAGAPTTGFNPGQSYQDAMMTRLSPQIDRENNQSDAQLANQGVMQGSEAYKNAKTMLGQQHNDLLNGATVQGLSAGLQANQQKFGQNQSQFQAANAANAQGFSQTGYNQMQPINVINALRTGSQVQSPSYVNVPQQQTTAGPDMMGAMQGRNQYNMGLYNSQVASNNSANGMLGTLATAGATAFSDVRLKTNIKRIGTHDSGIGIYSYIKFGMPEIGVLAHEVEKVIPDAVTTHASGFKMVDYGAI